MSKTLATIIIGYTVFSFYPQLLLKIIPGAKALAIQYSTQKASLRLRNSVPTAFRKEGKFKLSNHRVLYSGWLV